MLEPWLSQKEEKFLKKAKRLSDKKLGELIRTKKERKKKLKEVEYELYKKYREVYWKRREEEFLIFELMKIRGKKKGENCIARKEVTGRAHYWECLAKKSAWDNDLDRFYAYYCSRCRFTEKTKKMRVFLRKIGGKRDD